MKSIGKKILLLFFTLNIVIIIADSGEAVSAVGILSSLYITVISPDSGEIWKSGSVQMIKWKAPSKYFDNVKIDYTTDYGSSWITIIDSISSADTSFSWFVPYTPSYDCLVAIYETPFLYGEFGAYGYSYDAFMIWSPLIDTNSTIRITAPNGSEVWNAGITYKIEWQILSTAIDSLKVEYSTDSGDSWTIESNSISAADSSYDWLVPNYPSEYCLIRLSDAADSSNRDISNNLFTIDTLLTDVRENIVFNPKEYRILNAYPNPFNPSTTIQYFLPEEAEVQLFIYNISGEIIRKLIDGNESQGNHTAIWNGKNSAGNTVSSGVYFYNFAAHGIRGQKTSTRKIVLVK